MRRQSRRPDVSTFSDIIVISSNHTRAPQRCGIFVAKGPFFHRTFASGAFDREVSNVSATSVPVA